MFETYSFTDPTGPQFHNSTRLKVGTITVQSFRVILRVERFDLRHSWTGVMSDLND